MTITKLFNKMLYYQKRLKMDDKIRLSFEKVKRDIDFLHEEILAIRKEILEIKANFTDKSSIGNEGVPTDRQTDRQTSNRYSALVDDTLSPIFKTPTDIPAQTPTDVQQSSTSFQQIQQAQQTDTNLTEILDNLKTDLKKRFLSLTKQEFYIFSVLFTVEKSQKTVTYKDIALKTGLSESSIRDYIQKITKKGIPIGKERLNNKITLLKIPEEIRHLATLDNLLRLRNQISDSSLDNFTH